MCTFSFHSFVLVIILLPRAPHIVEGLLRARGGTSRPQAESGMQRFVLSISRVRNMKEQTRTNHFLFGVVCSIGGPESGWSQNTKEANISQSPKARRPLHLCNFLVVTVAIAGLDSGPPFVSYILLDFWTLSLPTRTIAENARMRISECGPLGA